MSKNTIDELEDSIKHCFYTYNMDTSAGGMDEEKALNYQVDAIKALISNREKLARLERGIYELERLHHIPQMFGDWESVIDDRIATLRKELESERKRINGTFN